MSGEFVDCGRHGRQPFSFACTHISHGLLDGTTPGFVINHLSYEEHPIAWCDACEREFAAIGDDKVRRRQQADYKLLCSLCYVEARQLAVASGRMRTR